MNVDLRLGRYQQALADVDGWDLLCFDAPYSERTHGGHDAVDASDGAVRREIDYWFWTEREVQEAIDLLEPRTRGWFATITDHVLAPIYEARLRDAGRYVFAPIPVVETGSRVRIQGDGPSSWTCWLVVARPRTKAFAKWGTLPGAYVAPRESKPIVGGKPLSVMRSIVRDYSRAEDLVCDITAGAGTTLLAARLEGRRAIGAESDPEHYRIASERLADVKPAVGGQLNFLERSVSDG